MNTIDTYVPSLGFQNERRVNDSILVITDQETNKKVNVYGWRGLKSLPPYNIFFTDRCIVQCQTPFEVMVIVQAYFNGTLPMEGKGTSNERG